MTNVRHPDGQGIQYNYGSANQLLSVSAPDGGSTSLSYNGTTSLLQSLTEPGGRTVSLVHDASGEITKITDADQFVRSLGGDGLGHVTSDAWDPYSATFTYDSASGLLDGVDNAAGSSYAIVSAAWQGLTAPVSGPVWATVDDGLGHLTKDLLDGRGRLLEQMLPSGATSFWQRNGAGQVTVYTDGRGMATRYTYVLGAYDPNQGGGDGDLVQVRYADGSYEQYQYDPIFHEVTQVADYYGILENDSYDPQTGDLLQTVDAYGDTTKYFWNAGLLLSVTDPEGHLAQNFYDSHRRLRLAYDNLGNPTVYGYDSSGNLSSVRDALARTTAFVYSGDNRLVQVIDANRGVSTWTYDAAGLVSQSADARQDSWSYSYDAGGLLLSQTDPARHTTSFHYDVAGNLTSQLDPRNLTTTFQYDADNQLSQVTDPTGVSTLYAYDPAGNVSSVTIGVTSGQAGEKTTFQYDPLERLRSATDPDSRTSTWGHDLAGNLTSESDPLGRTTTFFFDILNRPIGESDPRGISTGLRYDANGNVAETIDGNGQKTELHYDADNRLDGSRDPLGFTTALFYDRVGNLVKSVDENGAATLFQYDVLNQLRQVTDPAGHSTQLGHDAVGNVISSTDGNSHTTIYGYTPDDQLASITDPYQHTSTLQYDGDGNVTSSTDFNQQTTQFSYDQDNRLLVTTDPNQHTTGYSYTATGQLASSTDGDGNPTQYHYDPAGQLVGIVAPNNPPSGALTAFQYDAAGELSAETDPAGNTTRYGYDLSGNLASVTDAFSNSTQTTYDNNNQPIQTVDRDGRKKAFTYDKDGRLTNEAWYNAQGVQVDNRAYTYDKAGNLLSASNNYGSYVFTYDNAGKLLTQTGPFGLGLTYQYDGAGNVAQVADSRGGQVNSSYDNNNQLVSRTLSGTGLIPLRFDLGYTADGQVQTLTRYRDLAGTQKVSTSAFTYDDAGNLTDEQHTSASGAILSDYSYTYDRADQLASEIDNGTQTDYSYDPAGQLLSATVGRTTTSYSYDANGNRTLSGYVTDKDNELLSDGTWNYSYDAEGNVISKTNIATGAIWTYAYGLDNHLTSAVEKDSSGNLIQEVLLSYDVFGDLIEQDTYTASSSQWVVQRFARDAEGNVWADLDGNNNLVARRVYADINGQTQAMARETVSGGSATAAAWYLTDHLGSVRDIQDNATGTVIDHLDYDAYGNVVNQTQAGNGDRIEYAQGEWQAALGLYHFGERWYDPESGRWAEQDPLGRLAGSNAYRYVENGPTGSVDPSGLLDPKSLQDQLRQRFGAVPASLKAFGQKVISAFGDRLKKAAAKLKDAGIATTGILSGDIFDPVTYDYFPGLTANENGVLITVNGIRTTPKEAKELLDSVKTFNVGKRRVAAANGTHGFAIGDAAQILIEEVGIDDLTAIRLARQIEIAAQALRASGAKNPTIFVVAHSQGTKIFQRALDLLSPQTKRMIAYYGNAGEAFIPNNVGLKSAQNFIKSNDPVPMTNYLPLHRLAAILRKYTYILYDLGKGGRGLPGDLGAHSWAGNYASVYGVPGKLAVPKGTKRRKYP